MTRSAIIKRSGWLFLFVVLLAACRAEEDGDQPVPTRFDADAASTQLALQTTITAPPPTVEPATETPGITSTVTATETATAAPPTEASTDTPSPSETPSPAPTGLSDADQQSTWIAQTNTAIAAVQPFTQTVSAIQNATGTALAQVSATPTPTMTGTPEPEPFQVVFYTNRNGNDDIYLLTLNGVERAITRTDTNEREPSCSPDGRSVVFASDASGSYQIYLLPLNSTTPVQLTDSAGLNFAPVYSPDGSKIAFVSTRANGIPIIWVMNADGSNPQPITTELGRDTSPAWGPDGRQLLFSSDQFGPWDLFLTILEEDVEGEFPIMPPELSQGNQLWPVFDSLGERIAYTTFENLEDPQTSNIYILDFEQPEPLPIRVGPGADIAWSWGDDTHLLASVGGPDDVQIALVDITTREAVQLTHAGTFNGGARLCTVQPGILPPEPTPAPSPTPTLTPTIAPTTEPTVTPTETPVPTPTLSVLSPELMAAQGHRHVIQPGDTLMGLGYRYGVNWQDLAVINALPDPDRLSVGDALTIPVIHTAQRISGYQNPQLDAEVSLFIRKEIVVELSKQIVTAYENGRLVRTVTVSTGLPGTPTVQGEFSIYVKRPSQTMSGPGYFLPDVPYVMFFYQGYGLHGTYWHDNFGQPMSHGCVNLPTSEARWLYDWAEVGTPVLVKN